MACPFFKPLVPLDSGGWDPAPRLPLGDAWEGICVAAPGWTPSEATQRESCNRGYASGHCDHFPAGGADAVRFSLAGDRLIYILEKDHAPMEHGQIDCATDLREPLASQASAFMQSWRRVGEG